MVMVVGVIPVMDTVTDYSFGVWNCNVYKKLILKIVCEEQHGGRGTCTMNTDVKKNIKTTRRLPGIRISVLQK